MSAKGSSGISLGKCLTCHARFVPAGGPCTRCGSVSTELYVASGLGTVLAATVLEVPPAGWTAPHPLALVEVEDAVRLLVIPDPPLPEVGALLEVRVEGGLYRAGPPAGRRAERGEGDAPEAGGARPPFEPPR